MVCCRAQAATYIGRGGFGFVGRPFRATWWGGVCRAKAATYIGRGGFGFVGCGFSRLIHNPAFNIQKNLPCSKTDRKSTRLNSSHVRISYAVFCLKKKSKIIELAAV